VIGRIRTKRLGGARGPDRGEQSPQRRNTKNEGLTPILQAKETFNEYLNFHRPCGFATEMVDEKRKIKRKYETYLTPFEKSHSLPKPEQFLKNGV